MIAEAQEPRLARGQVLGRYVVLGVLGAGGMGVVYAAFDPQLDRKIALKLLRGETDREGQERLLREAQALARVSHPNVVAVHDVGVWDERVFMAMEYIDGGTLTSWLAERPRTPLEIVTVFRDAAAGLGAAHAAGLVHRDFKPDNVMIGTDGRARVVDFSLVSAATPSPSASERPSFDTPVDVSMTMSGIVLGTPLYMPLEVLDGHIADARSDQYSFCAAFYEALYGALPITAPTLEELYTRLHAGPAKPPARAGVSPQLRAAILRGLATRPGDRYPTMEAFLRALPVHRTRRLAGVIALLALVVLSVGVVAAHELRERRALLCSGGLAKTAVAWNAARRAEVSASFLATGRSYANETLQRVDQLLDEYSASWAASFKDTCEATRLRGEQSEHILSLRMECLDHRLEELAGLTELFSRADAAIVDHAVSAAGALRPIATCNESAALAARVAPPETRLQAEQVERVRRRIARTEAMIEAGRYADARLAAEEIIELERPVGYRPLHAEALFLAGVADERSSKLGSAEQRLYDAIDAAEISRHDELAARVWPELVQLQGNQLIRLADAERSAARAFSAQARIGEQGIARARLLDAVGLLRKEQGRAVDSVHSHEEAVAIASMRLGAEHALVGEIASHLASALREAGRVDESLAMSVRALGIQERARGKDHPDVAEVLAGLANTKVRRGLYAEAHALGLRALDIREHAFGPESTKVALSLNNLALVMRWEGKFAEALPLLYRARAIYQKVSGAESPDAAVIENNIGFTKEAMGAYAEAEESYRTALVVREKALGPRHPMVAAALTNLGHVALLTHRPELALADYTRALAIDERADNDPLNRAFSLIGIGQAYLALAHADKALGPLEDAYALRRDKAAPVKLAEAERHLARALWETGRDRSRAVLLATQARDRYATVGKGSDRERAEVVAWLAAHPRH